MGCRRYQPEISGKDIDDPSFNGARYVLPTEVAGDDEDIAQWNYGVFVRGDVPEALGIDPTSIKTTEELLDFMQKAKDYGFKDVNGNDCIVATTFHNGWSYDNYLQSYNAKKLTNYSLDADGNVTYDKLSENYVKKNLIVWKMVHDGLLDKECFTTTDDAAKEKSRQRYCIVYLRTVWCNHRRNQSRAVCMTAILKCVTHGLDL